MVEVIQGTDNSLTLAVLVGAWVFPTYRNHLFQLLTQILFYVLSTIGSDLPGDVI